MYSDVVIFRDTRPHCSVGCKSLISNGFHVLPLPFKHKWPKYLFRISRKLNIHSKFIDKFFLNIDTSILSKAAIIIVFDSAIEYYFCNYIQRNFSNKRLILYYWNTIDAKKKKEIFYFKKQWDIFSFNIDDCNKYFLKYNKLFSPIPNDFLISDSLKIKQDVFFVGKNKGRIKFLQELLNLFKKFDISYKFIVSEANNFYNENVFTNSISYNEVLEEDIQSLSILDINDNDKYGMTMRELEALFLKKKLITNNSMIYKRDYYHKNNIFIIADLKDNCLDSLRDFLNLPFLMVDDDIIQSYSVESWFQRFIK